MQLDTITAGWSLNKMEKGYVDIGVWFLFIIQNLLIFPFNVPKVNVYKMTISPISWQFSTGIQSTHPTY